MRIPSSSDVGRLATGGDNAATLRDMVVRAWLFVVIKKVNVSLLCY